MGFGRVFIVIFVFALSEAMVLGQVAESIGWGVTILLTVLTAMMGSLLFRWQGVEMWLRLNQRLQQGEMPGKELIEGVMLLLGGALLITPGFITDGIGFLLLLPMSRQGMASYALKKGIMKSMASRQGASASFVFRAPPQGNHRASPFEQGETFKQAGSQNQAGTEQGAHTRSSAVYEDRNGHLIIDGESESKDNTK